MHRKLLLLDLDLTLIFAWGYEPEWKYDFILNNNWVTKRPHLDKFMQYAFNNFDVGIFTAKNTKLANDTVSMMGINKSKLTYLKGGEGLEINYRADWPAPIKDLNFVTRRGYDLSQVLMVDDNKDGLSKNIDNLIPIEPFHIDMNDTELLKLSKYLDSIKNVEDVRTIDKSGWNRGI